VEKPLDEFCADKNRRDGKKSHCTCCQRVMTAAWRAKNAEHEKAYRAANKDRHAKWLLDNSERKKASDRAYRERNREKLKAQYAQWKDINREKIRLSAAEYHLSRKDVVRQC
jgi:predicted glycosyl hydrolase (DUF1957 family)